MGLIRLAQKDKEMTTESKTKWFLLFAMFALVVASNNSDELGNVTGLMSVPLFAFGALLGASIAEESAIKLMTDMRVQYSAWLTLANIFFMLLGVVLVVSGLTARLQIP